MLLISELLPKMQQMQASWKTNSMPGIIDFLASADLSDVLPPQPPLSPRKFVVSFKNLIPMYLGQYLTKPFNSGLMPLLFG